MRPKVVDEVTKVTIKPASALIVIVPSTLKSNIPDYEMPWEVDFGKPSRIDSALDIMLEGPIGAAAFNNEFGRPNIAGFFRTLEYHHPLTGEYFGYHKPLMLAGGTGHVQQKNWQKQNFSAGTPLSSRRSFWLLALSLASSPE